MAEMDTNMMDVDGDIILDVDPGMEAEDFQMQQPDAVVRVRGCLCYQR
jgi:hypothetical protein